MIEKKLIASVVLFKELYDGKKDVYDVLSELLKGAIFFDAKWSFNVTEATQLIEKTYGFKLPEAVIRTTISNRLYKKEKFVDFNNGIYSIVTKDEFQNEALSTELSEITRKQKGIIADLLLYIEKKLGKTLTEIEKDDVIECFSTYLMNGDASNQYSQHISSYIIERQSAGQLAENLSAVREGFVLYNGVRYSSDLNALGVWHDELTIYLDTDQLFNATGFGGVLYEQIFNDFYELVKEINHKKKCIHLKYFDECKFQIDSYFHVAELIIGGKKILDPSKQAMKLIVDGCKTKSDVLEKKSNFMTKLQLMSIFRETRQDFYSDVNLIVEGQSLLNQLKTVTEESGRDFDQESCSEILKMFTKINVLRKGANRNSFEKVRFILVTGNKFTQFVAFNSLIRECTEFMPYAVDIDFVINRLWFKLKKGLDSQTYRPKSFDVVAKAQVVLSSQINTSIAEKFDEMEQDLRDGKLSRQNAEYLYNELRSKTSSPENINPDTLESSLSFLSIDSLEDHLREKSILELKVQQGEKDSKELDEIKARLREENIKTKIRIINIRYFFILCFMLLLVDAYVFICFKLVDLIKGESDTLLSQFGTFFTIILGTLPFFSYTRTKSWFVHRLNESRKKVMDMNNL